MKILVAHHDSLLTTVGGIEKVCVTLANGLHAAGHEIIVATHAERQGRPFFPLEPGITFCNIYAAPSQRCLVPLEKYHGTNLFKKACYRLQKVSRTLRHFFTYGHRHKKVLRELLYAERAKVWKALTEKEKPDVIITMSMQVLREMTCGQTYTAPILHSVNSRPDYDYTDTAKRHSKVLRDSLKEPYKHLSGIHILFPSFKQFLPDTFKGKTYVIPNAVTQTPDSQVIQHTNEKERLTIINIARLDWACKQQHFAIQAFHKIANTYPDWDLLFWGDGSDKKRLEKLISDLGLQNRVYLKGVTAQPLEEMKKADIFIFPSRYEGFGISLAEAMSTGLPAIGLASCSGVNELIQDGKNGFLVTSVEECARRLEELIKSVTLRQQFGQNAHSHVKRFDPTAIIQQWLNALDDQYTLGAMKEYRHLDDNDQVHKEF